MQAYYDDGGLRWEYDDGGRHQAGYKGESGDCVVRAIAIATNIPYYEVRTELTSLARSERRGKRKRSKSHPDKGVYKTCFHKYLIGLGAIWTPTMAIGQGCRVHLRGGELPKHSRLIVQISKHLTAVVNGVIYDTFDPSRAGTRCVYGYYTIPPHVYDRSAYSQGAAMPKFSIKERNRTESITDYMTRIARTTPTSPNHQTFDQWVSRWTRPAQDR